MFGWHPALTVQDSTSSQTNPEQASSAEPQIFSIGVAKTQKKTKASKAKRRRLRKSKARRELAKKMRDLESYIDNLQIECPSKAKKTESKEIHCENFFSGIKARRQSRIQAQRLFTFDKDVPVDTVNENAEFRISIPSARR